MGLRAVYIAIDDVELKKLEERERETPDSEEDLVDKLEEFQENDSCISIDIDKMWDGLHFVLTGISASEPIESDALSELVVGVYPILFEDDFVSFSGNEDVERISEKISQINFDDFLKTFNPKQLSKEEIYPNIWKEEDKAALFEELKLSFNTLRDFYAKNKSLNLFVTIY